jgi:hypothetical protein
MPELLGTLRGKVRLALISDTAFSGGDTLRRFLYSEGILEAFEVLTFSDHVGWAKPHAAVFQHTLAVVGVSAERAIHVGDREWSDVVGAKGVGMKAILFRGGQAGASLADGEQSQADYIAARRQCSQIMLKPISAGAGGRTPAARRNERALRSPGRAARVAADGDGGAASRILRCGARWASRAARGLENTFTGHESLQARDGPFNAALDHDFEWP